MDRLFGGPRNTFEHCVINSLPATPGSDTRTLSRRSTATVLIYVLQGWADILPCQSTPFCSSLYTYCRGQLKCDGTRAETKFRLSAKRTGPFKSTGSSVQSTTDSRGVRISGSNAGYTMCRGSVKGTGYPLHSPVSPSLPFPCVTVCHHISAGVYHHWTMRRQSC